MAANSETLKGFIEGCPDGVGIIVDGRVEYANAKLRDMCGYRRNELIGKLASDFVTPADRGRAEERIQSLMKGEEAFASEYTLIRKDGQRLPIEVSSHQIEFAGKPAIMSLVRDNTHGHEIRKSLFDAEERYRTIVESAIFGIYQTTVDGRFISANQALADMLLYDTPEELVESIEDIGRQIHVDPSRRDEFARMLNESGAVTRFESEAYRKDGSRIWTTLTARAIHDAEGNVVSYEGMIEDVTEHKHADEELRNSEQRFKVLFEAAPDAYYLNDMTGTFVDGNAAAEELCGYKKDELIGKSYLELDLLPASQILKAAILLAKNVLGISTGPDPFELKRRDGTRVDVEITTHPVRVDGRRLVLGIARDITERKRIEQALQEREEQYRRMVEDVAHVVFTADNAGLFTYVNPQAARLTGFNMDEILGRHFTFLIRPDWKGRVIRFYQEQMESGERSTTLQFPIVTKRGDVRWVEQLVTLIPGKSTSAGAQAIVYDITERKEAEEALLKAHDELEDRVRERTSEIREANTQLKIELDERKKAEEALQSSEVRNQAIVDAIPDLLFRIGIDGTMKDYVAPTESLAIPPDQWLGKKFRDVMPQDVSDLVAKAMDEAVKERNIQSIEYVLPIPYPDGEPRHWEGRIVMSGDDEVLVIVRDVTERKLAEAAVERDARQREALAKIGRIVTSTLDVDDIYRRFNEELPKLITFDRISIMTADLEADTLTRAYVAGTNVSGWKAGGVFRLSGSDNEPAIQTKKGLLTERNGKEQTPGERRAQSLANNAGLRSGITIPLISNGQVIGTFNLRSKEPNAYTQKDVELAERLGAQVAGAMANAQLDAERRRSEEVLRITQYSIEHASDAVFWIGKDGGFQFVNEAACNTLGYTRDELLNMKISDINPDYAGSDWPEQWERVKSLGTNRIETTHLTRDGRTIPIEMTVNYLEFNGQEFNFAYARDITTRKQLESQLVESQKMEAVGRLAGGVAHDFNNFLTPIMSYAYLATHTPSLDGRLREYLGEIQKAAEHAANVTNQLLAFSRRQLIEPRVVDLNEVMLNMDRMLRRLLGEDLEMVAISNADPMLVKVDPGQIEQVLVNLVVNARDALPNGGKIILTTYKADETDLRSVSLRDGESDEYIVLSVEDNGIGMDDEVKSHIFEPFFTTKDAEKGTGLGLSTCYGIAKQAGGDIEVDSIPGIGTKFKVFLPRIKPTAGPLDKALANTLLPQGTETVLVVEDELMVRNVAAYSLKDLGYKVYEASNGDEALRLLENPDTASVDLVLSDIVMPLMGGVGLMEKLSQISPDVPVILTSGYADDKSLPQGILQPTTEFLRKPFTPADLAKKVRSVLDKGSKRAR